jgi:hypothetical protein
MPFCDQVAANNHEMLTGAPLPPSHDCPVSRILIYERDAVLAASIAAAAMQAASTSVPAYPLAPSTPPRLPVNAAGAYCGSPAVTELPEDVSVGSGVPRPMVVAVVGEAHVPGIESLWQQEGLELSFFPKSPSSFGEGGEGSRDPTGQADSAGLRDPTGQATSAGLRDPPGQGLDLSFFPKSPSSFGEGGKGLRDPTGQAISDASPPVAAQNGPYRHPTGDEATPASTRGADGPSYPVNQSINDGNGGFCLGTGVEGVLREAGLRRGLLHAVLGLTCLPGVIEDMEEVCISLCHSDTCANRRAICIHLNQP